MRPESGHQQRTSTSLKKINSHAHTDYHADAALNWWDFYTCATFKDTLTSGTRMQSLMGRLAATRGRVEFNGDLHRECGCREGMWTTPSVLYYWTARTLITLAVSRRTHTKKMSDKLHHSPAPSWHPVGLARAIYETLFAELPETKTHRLGQLRHT